MIAQAASPPRQRRQSAKTLAGFRISGLSCRDWRAKRFRCDSIGSAGGGAQAPLNEGFNYRLKCLSLFLAFQRGLLMMSMHRRRLSMPSPRVETYE